MHGHDHHPRQRGHAAHESTELVVGADHPQGDGLFGIELFLGFLAGLEQVGLDASRQCRLRDVHDQVGHFGLAGQLPQHLLELLLHLRQLLLEWFEVGGTTLLGLELGLQVGFFRLQQSKLPLLASHHQRPADHHDDQGHQCTENQMCLARPSANIAEIQLAEFELLVAHDAFPPAAGAAAGAAAPGAAGAPP